MIDTTDCSTFFKNLVRKKKIASDMQRTDLLRCFNLVDLTFLAISGMVGSGLYVLAGTVTRDIAGPSIVIGYLLAAVAAILSALCYAEFAARIPVAGSAYQFTYLSIGELWAFLIGWNVAFEHAIYASAIAKTSSGYFDNLIGDAIKTYLETHIPMSGKFVGTYPDFLAGFFILLFTVVLITGAKLSSKINITIASVNVFVIVFIIVTGMVLANWNNWFDVRGGFFPYGWEGTISGATTLVYSYVGYEVVASATEEAINAGRDIPLSLLISIGFVVITFVCGSAALTLMVPWYDVSPSTPFPSAYESRGWYWAKYVVSIGAIAAMLTSLLSILFVIPRYLLAMARDGLLWNFLTTIHPSTKVPYVSAVIVAVISAVMAVVFSLTTLVEMIAVGQLMACTFVAICVIKLRYIPNEISSYHRLDEYDVTNDVVIERTVKNSPKPEVSLRDRQNKETNLKMVASKAGKTNGIAIQSHSSANNEQQSLLSSNCGTMKKTVLYSKIGFLFQWTELYKPGYLPFFSLLIAIFCSTAATAMLLFSGNLIGSSWFLLVLLPFIVVAFCCICFISFFTQDSSVKTFQVPLVPFIPYTSIVINIALMLELNPQTWIRFGVWMFIGLIIYFAYGYRNSKARKENEAESIEQPNRTSRNQG